MADLNTVTITGNLTRDPELRTVGANGTSVCDLRVAVNGREKQGDQWVDRANYFDVTIWGRQGENAHTYLEKGRPVAIDGRLKEYIVDVAKATRDPKEAGLGDIAHFIQYGCSPRASIWLALASRAHAFLSGRGYVTPGDIKAVALQVLRHRLIPTYEAEAEGLTSDALVKRVLETVPVP